ncbi:MAG: GTP pyrophosphokinase (EC, (p)ppGpp synthetase II / Guanosine-3',5'-bis(diphosphate) 3'-pyrophosphohydrolase (EC [uncultured Thiotrichaceae bacterium]|uniref:guanosine-3',5'-bis(diphosphate) 3'-diphosphatase n=1 Tax=uncultured Thiotrichaceae bacterium TaxID=298394 RepID=A0A6S6TN21_9GAMM|nr:MAG: GTP pyrophosphokinase (EC, (p)ppGpp synthetase II / Guanosine-3',5'-bis(diphosphate) 3'-pyrophosphohydrolase (EC [uncultured Thiotrichaceae bacterium]
MQMPITVLPDTRMNEQRITFRMVDLCCIVERYMSDDDVKKVYDAFMLAAEAHDGIRRKSGEPYITHPIEVARILADMHLDADTVCAALLHDVIEDTTYTYDDIVAHFGSTVGHLVEGVTKLSQEKYKNKQEAGIASFQKMMHAMIEDYRVILIKLADRLHNVRTLGSMPPAKQRRIAKETLDIHVPLARRMGMNAIRRDLQLNAFQCLYPFRSQILENWWKSCYEEKKAALDKHEKHIQKLIEDENIIGNIFPWNKNLYRIYSAERSRSADKRFRSSNLSYHYRIVTRNNLDCYRVLGIVHQTFRRKIGTFKDFISVPKVYGYQALETIVITREKELIRFTIQSEEMFQVAQYGITAERRYPHLANDKKVVNMAQKRLSNWLEQVREIEQATINPDEFLADMKADFFFTEVSVTTPKGDSRVLRNGATPVDFAYSIHSDIGQHCVGAIIDGRPAALNAQLHDGASVEIITNLDARPHPSWLNFVVTGKARSAIRHWLNSQKEDEFIDLGRNILNSSIKPFGLDLSNITPNSKQQVLDTLEFPDEESLFTAIAKGDQCSKIIARRLLNNAGLKTIPENHDQAILIKGTQGLVVSISRCCHPIPDDTIVGNLSNKGLEVHRANCPMLNYTKSQEPLTLSWANENTQTFSVPIQIQTNNEVGVLFAITNIIRDFSINIEDLNISGDGNTKVMQLIINVKDSVQLHDLITEIKHESAVKEVIRTYDILASRGS